MVLHSGSAIDLHTAAPSSQAERSHGIDGNYNHRAGKLESDGAFEPASPDGRSRHDGHEGHDGSGSQDERIEGGDSNLHALRIEGRQWINDITLAQVWAVLKAAVQELDNGRDLLFMVLLPSGEQPALCLDRSLFAQQLTSPSALAAKLRPRSTH
ncbi:MAG: hypothetical protein ACRYGK_17590 [Janthinobacterium lividum]